MMPTDTALETASSGQVRLKILTVHKPENNVVLVNPTTGFRYSFNHGEAINLDTPKGFITLDHTHCIVSMANGPYLYELELSGEVRVGQTSQLEIFHLP